MWIVPTNQVLRQKTKMENLSKPMPPSALKRRNSPGSLEQKRQKLPRLQTGRSEYIKIVQFKTPLITAVRRTPRYKREDIPHLFYSRADLKGFREAYIRKRRMAAEAQLQQHQTMIERQTNGESLVQEDSAHFYCIQGVC
jgi:hypothetical protein